MESTQLTPFDEALLHFLDLPLNSLMAGGGYFPGSTGWLKIDCDYSSPYLREQIVALKDSRLIIDYLSSSFPGLVDNAQEIEKLCNGLAYSEFLEMSGGSCESSPYWVDDIIAQYDKDGQKYVIAKIWYSWYPNEAYSPRVFVGHFEFKMDCYWSGEGGHNDSGMADD